MKHINVVLAACIITLLTGGIGAIANSLSPYESPGITINSTGTQSRENGTITFLSDGHAQSFYIDEPEGTDIYDDILAYFKINYAGNLISNITDWDGNSLMEITIGGTTYHSFNESYLNELLSNYSPPSTNYETDYHCELTDETRTCDCLKDNKTICVIGLNEYECIPYWIKIKGETNICLVK